MNESMPDLFEKTDIVLCATSPMEPFQAEGPMPNMVGEVSVSPYNAGALTIPANLSGYPAVSIPAGISENGLPIGLQAYARRHEDALLLDLAQIMEQARPWPRTAPTRRLRGGFGIRSRWAVVHWSTRLAQRWVAMRVLTIAMLLSSAFFLAPLSTHAKGHIDQSAIGPEWGIFNIRDAGLEQTFRPESPILTGVTVGLDRMGQGPTNVTLTIRSDDSAGPIVGSTTKLISDYASGMPFDFLSGTHLEYFGFAAAPPLTPGHVYVIRLDADAGGLGWVNVGEDVYLPGQASSRWGPLGAGWDFIFQTCGDGQGKVCKEKTQLLDKTHKAKNGPGACIDFDAGTECSPF